MQDPNEDTEWNDLLRKRGIIPEKEPEVSEEQLAEMIEKSIQEHEGPEGRLGKLSMDELDEVEDDEDEALIIEFRNRRIAELKAQAEKARYGEVQEITAIDYVEKVNNAGEGIWVFLHLYKSGIPVCAQINQNLTVLARKFPQVKFIKAISTTCIPNYPDRNLPAMFVYFEGQMRKQFLGLDFGNKVTCDALEWILSRTGGFKTTLENDPRGPKVRDVMMSSLRQKDSDDDNDSDEDDW